MKRIVVFAVALMYLSLTGIVLAGGTPSLMTASGTLVKVEKDALTLKPRSAEGKFEKTLVLKITGTSKVSVLTQQKRAGKLVAVQKEIEAKELQPNQPLAVIYTGGATEAVLLSAVALPAASK